MVRKFWNKAGHAGQTTNSAFLCLVSKFSSDLILSDFLTEILLGSLHCLLAPFLSKYPMTLASQTTWVLQGIEVYTSQFHKLAYLDVHSGTPLRYAWTQWLFSLPERDSKYSFLTLKAEHMSKVAKFCCLLGLGHSLLVELHLHNVLISVVSFTTLALTLWTRLASNSEICPDCHIKNPKQ